MRGGRANNYEKNKHHAFLIMQGRSSMSSQISRGKKLKPKAQCLALQQSSRNAWPLDSKCWSSLQHRVAYLRQPYQLQKALTDTIRVNHFLLRSASTLSACSKCLSEVFSRRRMSAWCGDDPGAAVSSVVISRTSVPNLVSSGL